MFLGRRRKGAGPGIKEASVAVKCPETAMPQGREHIWSGNLRPREVMQRPPCRVHGEVP